jgi:hypothetical protein
MRPGLPAAKAPVHRLWITLGKGVRPAEVEVRRSGLRWRSRAAGSVSAGVGAWGLGRWGYLLRKRGDPRRGGERGSPYGPALGG